MRLPGNEDDQDVLELTEIAGPAPVSRWTRRHTRHLCTALAAVAGLVAFVGAAASPPWTTTACTWGPFRHPSGRPG
ncbi:hypothetical protein G7085_10085 [Tessaracoccus sp. HDW20]|uniref:hypothetical protein n=1 Tax=Tessaracoccus coleopterorum TaxID=2714950 RepID=UPI0018D37240|nr:hypothetical protein [Tessaracoccus coleopterorum]NHB84828.1 hypothetical protein [Tessaracoccus coleopterorum]